MEDDLLNSFAIPISISMGGSVRVFVSRCHFAFLSFFVFVFLLELNPLLFYRFSSVCMRPGSLTKLPTIVFYRDASSARVQLVNQ